MTLSQSLMMCPGLLMKLEMNNPGGSHKYRAARHIVESAIGSGRIVPGRTTVIEKKRAVISGSASWQHASVMGYR